MGLNTIRGGHVELLGQNLLSLKGEPLRQARRALQMVFQDPLACLNPALSVAKAIADPLLIHGLCSKASARQRARELMERVGLQPAEQFQDRLPRQLSGGQQQRVAIARAVANRPKVVLADEPTANLDESTGDEVLDLLRETVADSGSILLLVTHERRVHERFDDVMPLAEISR